LQPHKSLKDKTLPKTITLDRLRALIEVRDKGSLSSAAGASTTDAYKNLEKKVKGLEEFYGVALFVRNSGTLTRCGAELAQLTSDFLELLKGRTAFWKKNLVIRIGGGDSIVEWVIIPKLGQLEQRITTMNASNRIESMHATVKPMSRATVLKAVYQSEIDIGIIRDDGFKAKWLEKESLGNVVCRLYASKNLLTQAGLSLNTGVRKLLESLPIASQDNSQSFSGSMDNDLMDALENAGVQCRPRVCCDG
jgi:DNA-binding transcriptional LysR family regulator